MQEAKHRHFDLEPEALELLAWNVPNEILHGFKVNDFDRTIGATKEQVRDLAIRLQGLPGNRNHEIDHHEALVFRNALAVVIAELGEEEFHTRTGHDFEFGQRLHEKLRRFSQQEMMEAGS